MPEGTIYQEGVPATQNIPESPQATQVTYVNPDNSKKEEKPSGFHPKKIIKIGIFIFIILTIIFVVLS